MDERRSREGAFRAKVSNLGPQVEDAPVSEAIDRPPGSLRVGYFGSLVGRYVPGQWGSGFVLALASLPEVAEVGLVTPELDSGEDTDPVPYPPKVRWLATYRIGRIGSLLHALRRLRAWRGDLLVFSANTTSFGSRSVASAAGLCLPWLARRLLGLPVVLVYHSSLLTTDVRELGYHSAFDRLRGALAARLERALFRGVPTFVLLRCYRDRLLPRVAPATVRFFANEFLEAIPTITINRLEDGPSPGTSIGRGSGVPAVLLHGYWGPQKNLEGALASLRTLAREGLRFRLTLSGSANPHFPEYRERLDSIAREYADIVTERLPSPSESAIAGLMLDNDLLLLPYNASGGQSGVLEIASCFDLPTIVVDFPEYREKAATKPGVVLAPVTEWTAIVRRTLEVPSTTVRSPALSAHLGLAHAQVRSFLEEALASR